MFAPATSKFRGADSEERQGRWPSHCKFRLPGKERLPRKAEKVELKYGAQRLSLAVESDRSLYRLRRDQWCQLRKHLSEADRGKLDWISNSRVE